jgi:hypothetical protein
LSAAARPSTTFATAKSWRESPVLTAGAAAEAALLTTVLNAALAFTALEITSPAARTCRFCGSSANSDCIAVLRACLLLE